MVAGFHTAQVAVLRQLGDPLLRIIHQNVTALRGENLVAFCVPVVGTNTGLDLSPGVVGGFEQNEEGFKMNLVVGRGGWGVGGFRERQA